MPSADIEGVKKCLVESEFKSTRGLMRGVSMSTSTLVVSPSCSPHKRLQVGLDIEAGKFWSSYAAHQNFVGNPRVRGKVNLISHRRPGGWEKLTLEVKVPLDVSKPIYYYAKGGGIWKYYDDQIQGRTTGTAPQSSLYFGIDRASWIATFGAHYMPAWKKEEITMPEIAGATLTFQRLIQRFENGAEVSMLVGANDHQTGQAKVNGLAAATTGGHELIAQIGVQWALSAHHVLEFVYEKPAVQKLGRDQFPQSNTLRVAYRFRH